MANAKSTKKTKTKSAKTKSCSRRCTIPKYEYVVLATNNKPKWYLLYGSRVFYGAINQKTVDDGEIYPIAYIYTNTYISLLDALKMATRGRVKTTKDMYNYMDRRKLIALPFVDIDKHKISPNLTRCER